MIETGTYNLIYIMTRMGRFEDEETTENDIKFVLKSMEAIRKATSCRVIELLDSFVARIGRNFDNYPGFQPKNNPPQTFLGEFRCSNCLFHG